jgi:thiosulfate/3-mercaptopyruvate sulfurtransferase
MDSLVDTAWLAARLGAPGLVVLDATYFALEPERDARAAFVAGHVPGARFLDLEHLADPADPLPGMRPPREQAEARLREIGVSQGDRIVLYDGAPHRTAARAWWLLRSYGLRDLAILDGGLARWTGEGRPLEGSEEASTRGDIRLGDDRDQLATRDDLLAILSDKRRQVIDARGLARFSGAEADPRPGVAPGHIPGSVNLPYGALFEADGRWKRGGRLRTAFEDAGIDVARPAITTCGSGVTASILLFGLHLLGQDAVKLYDGSWSEWGADPALPKAVGAA